MEIYNDTYCVYMHTNKINGKRYVGITKYGDDPNQRWHNGKAYPLNQHFSQAIKKYGWDNFEHEIIASNLTESEAKSFESLLIDKLDLMNQDKGYNLNSGGATMQHSEHTKRQMSMSHSKRICQYNTNGDFIKTWGSIILAGTELGIDPSHIAKCCKNKCCTAGGFVWQYEGDTFYLKEDPHLVPVYQFDRNGVFIKKWDSIIMASKTLNINASAIGNCCNGRLKTAGGFIWSKNDCCVPVFNSRPNVKAVVQCSLDDIVITIWPTMSTASKELGINLGLIGRCCKGYVKTAGGFKWRYATNEEIISFYTNYTNIK